MLTSFIRCHHNLWQPSYRYPNNRHYPPPVAQGVNSFASQLSPTVHEPTSSLGNPLHGNVTFNNYYPNARTDRPSHFNEQLFNGLPMHTRELINSNIHKTNFDQHQNGLIGKLRNSYCYGFSTVHPTDWSKNLFFTFTQLFYVLILDSSHHTANYAAGESSVNDASAVIPNMQPSLMNNQHP